MNSTVEGILNKPYVLEIEPQGVDVAKVSTLCDGRPGAEGAIVYLATQNKREVQKMMAMGILPGTPIQLIQRTPSYVFQIGYGQFAVDQRLAAIIMVRWQLNPV